MTVRIAIKPFVDALSASDKAEVLAKYQERVSRFLIELADMEDAGELSSTGAKQVLATWKAECNDWRIYRALMK